MALFLMNYWPPIRLIPSCLVDHETRHCGVKTQIRSGWPENGSRFPVRSRVLPGLLRQQVRELKPLVNIMASLTHNTFYRRPPHSLARPLPTIPNNINSISSIHPRYADSDFPSCHQSQKLSFLTTRPSFCGLACRAPRLM
jgi:hypothetical protein